MDFGREDHQYWGIHFERNYIKRNMPLYLLFLDYEKAYDQINREKPWDILDRYKIDSNLINALKSLYTNHTICIKMTTIMGTKSMQVNRYLRQGCGISSLLCYT